MMTCTIRVINPNLLLFFNPQKENNYEFNTKLSICHIAYMRAGEKIYIQLRRTIFQYKWNSRALTRKLNNETSHSHLVFKIGPFIIRSDNFFDGDQTRPVFFGISPDPWFEMLLHHLHIIILALWSRPGPVRFQNLELFTGLECGIGLSTSVVFNVKAGRQAPEPIGKRSASLFGEIELAFEHCGTEWMAVTQASWVDELCL